MEGVKCDQLEQNCDDESMLESFKQAIEDLFVPEAINGFDSPLTKVDYKNYLLSCDSKFEGLAELYADISHCKKKPIQYFRKWILPLAIILRGEHHFYNNWTTDITLNKSDLIFSGVLYLCEFESVKDALVFDNCSVFKLVMKKIRPCLLKDTWKHYPAKINCFQWILQYIKSPNLSDFLDSVLPTALILTDDFTNECRIIGLHCLEHIIDNVAISHLEYCGHDVVILKTLELIFYHKDAELIIPLTNAFAALLSKKYPPKRYAVLQMTEYDESISKFIQNMVMEQNLKLRSAFTEALPKIIFARGLGMVLHSSLLINVIYEYVLEPTSSLGGLYILQSFIEVCWPRIKTHCHTCLVLLCKVQLGLIDHRYPTGCQQSIREIFLKLNKLCPDIVNKFIASTKDEESLKELQLLYCD